MAEDHRDEIDQFVAGARRQAEYEIERFPNDDWPPIVLALLKILDEGPKVSTRRTDWGVRDDATGNVGTVLAYNRATTEQWLAELTEPSTLMRRERTTYEDDVTEWSEVVTPPVGGES